MAKIGIIGTGLVGATSAYALLLSGVADELLLIDINEKRAHGEMLDLTHSMPLCPPAKVGRSGGLRRGDSGRGREPEAGADAAGSDAAERGDFPEHRASGGGALS